MQNKQWRLENAKLARAYIEGGMPPFQAAQKCGFMRLNYLEDALRELENSEKASDKMQPAAAVPVQKTSAGPLEQIGEWRNSKFLIKRFAPQGDYPEMIRLFAGGRTSYIYFAPEDIPLLQSLLREVNGEKDRLLADFAELTEERNHEAKGHLAELEKNAELEKKLEELQVVLKARETEIATLKHMLKAMENATAPDAEAQQQELAAQKLLNQKLKDKLVEMLLGV